MKINGKLASFGWTDKNAYSDGSLADYPRFWCSGGYVKHDEEGDHENVKGPWEMSFTCTESQYPKHIWKILPDILAIMNDHVPYGCCGGCW